MTAIPETRFAKVGNDRVAYQVLGEGPGDVVLSGGPWGHLDVAWQIPAIARFLRRLASFSRLICFSPRGAGLSDARPPDGRDLSEHWSEDLLAVLDHVGSRSAALIDVSASCGLVLPPFAAAHPERVSKLVLLNPTARFAEAPDYPNGLSREAIEQFLEFTLRHWGTEKWALFNAPSLSEDARSLKSFAAFQRASATPRTAADNFRHQMQADVRSALPLVRAPVLVLMRRNYAEAMVAQGRYVAERLAVGRFVELPGRDGMPFWEAPDLILDHIEEFLTGVRGGGRPERALVAILFTDIVDSTKRAAEMGDAQWRALLDRHDEILREQVGLFGGKVADHAGDGSLSSFDSPRRAIDCAAALRKVLADNGVRIRSAVHFGEVERRTDGGLGGMSVHIGARVLALAGPGESLVSGTVRDILIGSKHRFEDRGSHALKGVPGDWPVLAITG